MGYYPGFKGVFFTVVYSLRKNDQTPFSRNSSHNGLKNKGRKYLFGLMFTDCISILFKQPAVNIISVRKEHQSDKDNKSHKLGIFHEFLIRFSSCHHFI